MKTPTKTDIENVIDNFADEEKDFSAYDVTKKLRDDGFWAPHREVRPSVHEIMEQLDDIYEKDESGSYILYKFYRPVTNNLFDNLTQGEVVSFDYTDKQGVKTFSRLVQIDEYDKALNRIWAHDINDNNQLKSFNTFRIENFSRTVTAPAKPLKKIGDIQVAFSTKKQKTNQELFAEAEPGDYFECDSIEDYPGSVQVNVKSFFHSVHCDNSMNLFAGRKNAIAAKMRKEEVIGVEPVENLRLYKFIGTINRGKSGRYLLTKEITDKADIDYVFIDDYEQGVKISDDSSVPNSHIYCADKHGNIRFRSKNLTAPTADVFFNKESGDVVVFNS